MRTPTPEKLFFGTVLLTCALFAAVKAFAAPVILSNGGQCVATQVVVTCAGDPQPPVTPVTPVTPGGVCSGPGDLSDTTPKLSTFYSGQNQTFCFRTRGGYVDLTLFTVSGSHASSAVDTGPGFTERYFAPAGSLFRVKGIEAWLPAGTYFYTIRLNDVVGGAGTFGLQAIGVGP